MIKKGMSLLLRICLLGAVFLAPMSQQVLASSNQSVDANVLSNAEVQKQLAQNKWLYELSQSTVVLPIRQGLDSKLRRLIDTNPTFAAIYDKVKEELFKEVDIETIRFMLSSAKAKMDEPGKPGHYQKLLSLAHKVARIENFLEDDINKMHVFVLESGEENAFTYSPGPGKGIFVVFYSGLLNKLNDSQIESILAHEFGHIKSEHVVMGEFVQAVYRAYGKIIVPNDPDPSTILTPSLKDNIKILANSTLHSHRSYESILGLDQAGGHLHHSEPSQSKKLVDAFTDRLERVVVDVVLDLEQKINTGQVDREAFLSAAEDLKALHEEAFQKSDRAQELAKKKASDEDSSTDQKQKNDRAFEASAVLLSHDIESTADAVAQIYNGLDSSKSSMALLAGGPEARVELIEEQADFVLSQFTIDQLRQMGLDHQDHPSIGLRIKQATWMKETLLYKMMHTDFLRSMHLAQRLSQIITNLQKVISKTVKPSDQAAISKDLETIKAFRKTLSQKIVEVVQAEVLSYDAKSENSLKNFNSFLSSVEALQKAISEVQAGTAKKLSVLSVGDYAQPLANDMADKEGVLNQLNAMLLANGSNAIAKKMHDDLNAKIKLDESFMQTLKNSKMKKRQILSCAKVHAAG